MNKNIQWRIQIAAVLTSLGVLYYLVFLFYFSGGVAIDKVHDRMTEGWPTSLADWAPWISPIFLFLGLYLWYSYNSRNKVKPAPEPEYHFEFNLVTPAKTEDTPPAEEVVSEG